MTLLAWITSSPPLGADPQTRPGVTADAITLAAANLPWHPPQQSAKKLETKAPTGREDTDGPQARGDHARRVESTRRRTTRRNIARKAHSSSRRPLRTARELGRERRPDAARGARFEGEHSLEDWVRARRGSRLKRWPDEAHIETSFPRFAREPLSYDVTPAADGRPLVADRAPNAPPLSSQLAFRELAATPPPLVVARGAIVRRDALTDTSASRERN